MFIPNEQDYEAAKANPTFARASEADKYRLAFVEQAIRLFGKRPLQKGSIGKLGERRGYATVASPKGAGSSGKRDLAGPGGRSSPLADPVSERPISRRQSLPPNPTRHLQPAKRQKSVPPGRPTVVSRAINPTSNASPDNG